MVNETAYIESLDKLMDPTNKIIFQSATKREFIYVVILLADFMGDQSGKINYANHSGGSSDYGGTHGLSCDWKEMFHEVPSCQDGEKLL